MVADLVYLRSGIGHIIPESIDVFLEGPDGRHFLDNPPHDRHGGNSEDPLSFGRHFSTHFPGFLSLGRMNSRRALISSSLL
jgi:hypothetical protein